MMTLSRCDDFKFLTVGAAIFILILRLFDREKPGHPADLAVRVSHSRVTCVRQVMNMHEVSRHAVHARPV